MRSQGERRVLGREEGGVKGLPWSCISFGRKARGHIPSRTTSTLSAVQSRREYPGVLGMSGRLPRDAKQPTLLDSLEGFRPILSLNVLVQPRSLRDQGTLGRRGRLSKGDVTMTSTNEDDRDPPMHHLAWSRQLEMFLGRV
jgi:hypothetical protein